MSAMTRGQFINQLVAKLGLTERALETGGGGFSDTAGTYFDAAATLLKELGVISGTGNTTFDPSRVITRAEAATIFARAAGLSESGSTTFSDLGESGMNGWINAAGEAGLFSGVGGSKFDPNGSFDSSHFDIVFDRGSEAGLWENSTLNPGVTNTPPPVPPPPVTPPEPPVTPVVPSEPPDPKGEHEDPIKDRSAMDLVKRLVVEEWGIDDPGVIPFLEQAFDEQWSVDEIMLRLYENQDGSTDWFHERFPGYEQLPENAPWPSPAEYVALEQEYARVLRSAGVPEGFHDDLSDFTDWIVGNVSPAELARRVKDGFSKVQASDPALRQAFTDLFGVTGDDALAAFYMDMDKTEELLAVQTNAAGIAASSGTLGISVGLDRAMQLAGIGHTRQSTAAGFSRLDAMAALFDETMTEAQDFTVEEEGIDSQFGLQAGAQAALEKRRMGRINAFRGGSRAVATEQGIIGA